MLWQLEQQVPSNCVVVAVDGRRINKTSWKAKIASRASNFCDFPIGWPISFAPLNWWQLPIDNHTRVADDVNDRQAEEKELHVKDVVSMVQLHRWTDYFSVVNYC